MSDQRDVIFRPKPPVSKSGRSLGEGFEKLTGVYLVRQDGALIAAYNGNYFLSTKEVVGDFIELIRANPEWRDFDDDYAIWFNQSPGWRVVALLQWRADKENQKAMFFEEARYHGETLPSWPTRAEWIESGHGDLWQVDRPEFRKPTE